MRRQAFVGLFCAALVGSPLACHRAPLDVVERHVQPTASVPPTPMGGSTPGRWANKAIAPSEGCNHGRAADGERTLLVNGVERQFIVSVPWGYDGSVPYPLAFAFHGKSRTHRECQDVDCRGFRSVLGDHAILVYMKSLNAGWRDDDVGFANNLPFFAATIAVMKAQYCVDENRVLASGTSSGAYFANELACKYGDQLMAVFPVGGGLTETEGCQRPIPAIVLHGVDDTHVTFDQGERTRDYYAKRNGCTERTHPTIGEAHDAVRAARDGGQETYRCVDYERCRSGLNVRWCEHSEGGYDNSTHAWPTFGGQILGEFLEHL
jgi:poly(3-hydroxybutyrate) depolymerase